MTDHHKSNTDLNILFVTLVDLTGTSGQNIYSKSVASSLANRKGVNVEIVCPSPKNELPEDLSISQLRYYFLPEKENQSIIWNAKLQFHMYHNLRKAFSSSDFDGLVCPLKPGMFLPPFLSMFKSVPQILLVEGLMAKNVGQSTGSRIAESMASVISFVNSKQSTQIFTAYEEGINWLSAYPTINSNKMDVFNHGVDIRNFDVEDKDTMKEHLNVTKKSDLVVGFVGSFKEYHCLDQLLKSVASARDSGLNIELLLIGEGPQKPHIEQLAEQLGLKDITQFTGFVPHEDVSKYIGACDLLYGVIDPQHWGSPMKVYEYLGCGRPALAFQSEELMFVKDTNSGWLVETIHPDDIEEKLSYAANLDENELISMGISGRKYIAQNRTWSALANEIVAVIEENQSGVIND
ncbi:glycosyltransferase [Natronorubrum halophilum]|uniref:glycosyltransferase n=1 Tax=Natronorubrum halophilum TaxID=1702106 RepID=UPI0010C1656F|nr:glycosyltransferase [Natronorubrum halophilum]